MKNFKREFLMYGLLVFVLASQTYAQTAEPASENLSEFYREYYQITSVDGGNRALTRSVDRSDDNRFNLFEGTYRGLDRQHWLIMPSAPGSGEYFLIETQKGLIADIFTNGNLASKKTFTGDNNQTFQFTELDNGKVRIKSPNDLSTVLTRRPSKNIVFRDFNPSEPQEFELITRGELQDAFTSFIPQINVSIPQPPAPTSLAAENQCIKCNEQVVGETIIPFVMVQDPSLNTAEKQLNFSPYYKVIRSQYWQQVDQPVRANPGSDREFTFIQTRGIERFKQTELSTALSIGFTLESEVSFEGEVKGKGKASARVAKTFSAEFNISRTLVNSITETSEETFQFKRTFEDVAEPTVFVEYQLVDHYELVRMDGEPVLDWEVFGPIQSNTEVSFPPQSQGSITISPRTIIASNLTADEVIAIEQVNASVRTGVLDTKETTYTVELVSSNPFTNQLDVAVNVPAEGHLQAILYNYNGEEKKYIHKSISEKGKTRFSIQGDDLNNGLYLLKVLFTDKNGGVHQEIKRVMKQ